MASDPIPPAGLHPELVKRLLDKLESDKEFRAQFQSSAEDALRSLGYQDPWACMRCDEDAELPAPEDIREQREKLETVLTSAMSMVIFKL